MHTTKDKSSWTTTVISATDHMCNQLSEKIGLIGKSNAILVSLPQQKSKNSLFSKHIKMMFLRIGRRPCSPYFLSILFIFYLKYNK